MTRFTNFINNYNGSIAVLGTWFTWLFGGWDLALKSLVVFNVYRLCYRACERVSE